jgi:hypothetical protein
MTLSVKQIDRRSAIRALGSLFVLSCCKESSSDSVHPHIYIQSEKKKGLRSLGHLRQSIRSGFSQQMWVNIQHKVAQDSNKQAWTPASLFPGRDLNSAKHKNPDYSICRAVGQRILRGHWYIW